jgi:hypothetical protein
MDDGSVSGGDPFPTVLGGFLNSVIAQRRGLHREEVAH